MSENFGYTQTSDDEDDVTHSNQSDAVVSVIEVHNDKHVGVVMRRKQEEEEEPQRGECDFGRRVVKTYEEEQVGCSAVGRSARVHPHVCRLCCWSRKRLALSVFVLQERRRCVCGVGCCCDSNMLWLLLLLLLLQVPSSSHTSSCSPSSESPSSFSNFLSDSLHLSDPSQSGKSTP